MIPGAISQLPRAARAVRALSVLGAVALLGCGAEVSAGGSPSGGGGGAAGGGAAGGGAGGSGGAGGAPVCSEACIECCNDPRCPDERPWVGQSCDAEAVPGAAGCTYFIDGCLHEWWCNNVEPNTWVYGNDAECEGTCPGNRPYHLTCLEVGKVCYYPSEISCEKAICGADHKWEIAVADDCP